MAKKGSKHIKKENKKYKGKSYKKIAFAFILAILVIIIINLKKSLTNTNYEQTQIILNNENITSNLQEEIIEQNEKIYMSFKDIQKFLDSTIYQEGETIITTSEKKLATLKKDEEAITINSASQKVKNAIIEKDEKTYIAISEMENVYDYEFKYIQETNTITIDYLNKQLIKAYAKKNINIKKENKLFSETLDKVKKGEWLIYIGKENNSIKVRTQKGIIGYVSKNALDNFITERENFEETNSKENNQNTLEYNLTGKDISTIEKRIEIINLILQETINNDKMSVKIIYNEEKSTNYERFKIEINPILKECGITVNV